METKINVIHIRDSGKDPNFLSIYVGRKGSKSSGNMKITELGNPYRVLPEHQSFHNQHGITSPAVEDYRKYLFAIIQKHRQNQPLTSKEQLVINDLLELVSLYKQGQNLELICFCKRFPNDPNTPCHADIIKRAIIWLSNE